MCVGACAVAGQALTRLVGGRVGQVLPGVLRHVGQQRRDQGQHALQQRRQHGLAGAAVGCGASVDVQPVLCHIQIEVGEVQHGEALQRLVHPAGRQAGRQQRRRRGEMSQPGGRGGAGAGRVVGTRMDLAQRRNATLQHNAAMQRRNATQHRGPEPSPAHL